MDIVKAEKGEVDISFKLEEGKLKLAANYDGKGVDAGLSISADPEYFIDKLAEAIPGQVDDAIFAVLKAALKK